LPPNASMISDSFICDFQDHSMIEIKTPKSFTGSGFTVQSYPASFLHLINKLIRWPAAAARNRHGSDRMYILDSHMRLRKPKSHLRLNRPLRRPAAVPNPEPVNLEP
jgi:hypothetical protein